MSPLAMKGPTSGSAQWPERSLRRAACALARALLLGAWVGCGSADRDASFARRTVPIGEIPPNVMGAAKQALPGVDFHEAWQNVDRDGRVQSFEIRGRTAEGQTREARVSLTGDLLEKE